MTRKIFLALAAIALLAACDQGNNNANAPANNAQANPLGLPGAPASETAPAPGVAMPQASEPQTAQVFVNRVALDQQTLAALAQFGAAKPGRYWYDPISGLWGIEGGPYMGILQPGMNLGGPMPADISGGGTGVFINGREIHTLEYKALLAAFGTVIPGRYWLRPDGWLGQEGGAPLVNLAQTAKQGSGGGAWSSYSSFGGTAAQDENGCSYFQGTGSDYATSWSNC